MVVVVSALSIGANVVVVVSALSIGANVVVVKLLFVSGGSATSSGAQILSAVAEPEEISVSLVLHSVQLEHKRIFSATENVSCGQVLHL